MTPHPEWNPPEGGIEFPGAMGTCRITAELLTLEATDSANLARMQQIISRNIERSGSGEGLAVEWSQP